MIQLTEVAAPDETTLTAELRLPGGMPYIEFNVDSWRAHLHGQPLLGGIVGVTGQLQSLKGTREFIPAHQSASAH